MKRPEMCANFMPTIPCVAIIKWGEDGYYPTDYPADKETADYINEKLGLTQEQVNAMVCCSMVCKCASEWESHYDKCMGISARN